MTESPAARRRRIEGGAEQSEGPGSNEDEDPLRVLARERGRLMGELGVRPGDDRWARAEADAIASLVRPGLAVRLPAPLGMLLSRLRRAFR